MSYPYSSGQQGSQYQGRYSSQYHEGQTNGNGQYPTQNNAPPLPSWDTSNGYAPYPSGGPVQQPHANVAYPPQPPPRSPSYGAFHSQQQQQQQQQQEYRPNSYNPQEYLQSPTQSMPQYNPQLYAPTSPSAPLHRTSSISQNSYNPADYASPPLRSPTTAQYPYVPSAYSPPQPQQSGYPQSISQTSYPYQQSLSIEPRQSQSQYSHSHPPAPPEHFHAPQQSYTSISPSALPGLTPDELNLPTPPARSDLNIYYSDNAPPGRQSGSPSYSASQLPSPPAPPPPAHGSPRRSNTQRHPQLRPLPGPPSADIEPDLGADYFLQRPLPPLREKYTTEEEAQDDLFNQVESAVLSAGRASNARRHSPRVDVHHFDQRGYSGPTYSPDGRRNGSTANDYLSPEHTTVDSIINEYSDEDAEALAGLEAMRMADEQDAVEEARRQSGGSGLFSNHSSMNSRPQRRETEESFGGVDMSTLDGGYGAELSYGIAPNASASTGSVNGIISHSQPPSAQNSQRSSHRSHASSIPSVQGSLYDSGSISQRPFLPAARVDGGGTGGLSVPARRQSYDEGDEYTLMDDYARSWEPPDLFFHPEPTSTHRPLPPPPAASDDEIPRLNTGWQAQSMTPTQPPYPVGPGGYERSTTDSDIWVPRSASLISREPAPIIQPIRSKTDAEDRRPKPSYRNSAYSGFETTPAAGAVAVDLPSLPTKRFNPAKLGNADFKRCEEPWALSSLLQWLLLVADPEKIAELKESMLKDALVALFTNKVPTMNIADAEVLSNRVVDDMYSAGTMVRTEEWVKLTGGSMNGVIFQLTMAGCYAPTVHNHIIPGRCYAHHCQRTLKKVNLQAAARGATEDWATFYNIKKEDVDGVDKKEIELQNNLHEIIQTEEGYMENIDVLVRLYRDPLSSVEPSIINPKRVKKFIADVFGKIEGVKKANEEHLLPQLKYRQIEQGPWVKGFSDIFRQWIRKAKVAYIEYAAAFPGASLLVRQEIERNLDFRAFIERARSHKMSNKLGWDNYIKAPITRLQRYSLLLQTVHKNMKQDSEERSNLQTAIDEIRAVTLDCDHRVAEMQAKVDLMDLNQKLVLRPGMQQEVELNLNYLGRELIFRGDLQRAGQTRLSWVDTHAVLFDHYLVLAKAVNIVQKGTGGKIERYDVSRLPIPMDLLILESPTEDAVVKGSYVRGITSVTPVPHKTASSSPDPSRLGRVASYQPGRPEPLSHVNTTSSMTNLTTVNSAASARIASPTVLDGPRDSERVMYPFRVHHLGKDVYTLFAPTSASRNDWCKKIIEAKTKHAAALYTQNAEPLSLRVMADSAFYHDSYAYSTTGTGIGKPVVIKGTPTDRAIKEVEHRFRATGRPAPICRARVNCATSFTTPYPGKHMVVVGTDYGVYVSEMDNPRGWHRTLTQAKVTQIAVLEEFSLLLLLADKALIAYHLDAICPPDRPTNGAQNDTARKAPQKLSGSRDVGFFAVGRMKERTLVFYKKREGVSSIFKVLEPVFQKTTEKKRGIFKRGTTDFFRDYDDFYVATECTGINLFQNSLAVSTDRGFEVLTLDKKQPWGVPDWQAPEVANIATHVEKQTTLGMLRLNDQEFLLCYEKCAVYVNKHGDVCRSVVMNFVAKAKSAALYGPYLILFDTDFVEVRDAQNGRLKQIIAGRDIKCLDDGGGGTISGGSTNTGVVNGIPTGLGAASRTVKVVMQHPELERTQVVVELVLNDSLKE